MHYLKPRAKSQKNLRFSVWSLANGWSRSSKAQQSGPVSGEIQHTIYTVELPDSIRPRSGFYLKSHPSLAPPFLITAFLPPPFLSFFLTFHYPSLLRTQPYHRFWLPRECDPNQHWLSLAHRDDCLELQDRVLSGWVSAAAAGLES